MDVIEQTLHIDTGARVIVVTRREGDVLATPFPADQITLVSERLVPAEPPKPKPERPNPPAYPFFV